MCWHFESCCEEEAGRHETEGEKMAELTPTQEEFWDYRCPPTDAVAPEPAH